VSCYRPELGITLSKAKDSYNYIYEEIIAESIKILKMKDLDIHGIKEK
jgi:hypothetical protein